ncbi:MAG: ArsR/SmtB family transcription factor [Alphaproteobacteria bacterium]
MALPVLDNFEASNELDEIAEQAKEASDFLKALAHESRLMILCILSEGEKSVTDLESLLALRQPTVSQQLARLRFDRLVETRREGKTIIYSLSSNKARSVVELVYDLFCSKKDATD